MLLVALTALASCQNKPVDQAAILVSSPDTLHYAIKTIKKTTGECKTESELCASIIFTYPEFTGEGAAAINNWVNKMLGMGYMDTLIHAHYEEVMAQYLASYDTMRVQMPDLTMGWNYTKVIEVSKQIPGYLTAHISIYEFSGGAHPNFVDQYHHFEIASGREIMLSELLLPGGESEMKAIAEGIFRKEFKLDDKINLDTAGFFFEKGKFSLPSNYLLTSTGIQFHYNDYEIRSHAEGPYDLIVPFAAIEKIAKPNSYLGSIINLK